MTTLDKNLPPTAVPSRLHPLEVDYVAQNDPAFVGRFDESGKPLTRLDLYVETLGDLEGKLKDVLILAALLSMHAVELDDDSVTGLGEYVAQSESASLVATLADARRRVQLLLTAEIRKEATRAAAKAETHEALVKTKEFIAEGVFVRAIRVSSSRSPRPTSVAQASASRARSRPG
jgi:hypothetical protein